MARNPTSCVPQVAHYVSPKSTYTPIFHRSHRHCTRYARAYYTSLLTNARDTAGLRLTIAQVPPVPFRDELVWVGSTGLVYTLPALRIAGLYAPANGEVSTVNFTVPESALWNHTGLIFTVHLAS